MEKRRVCRKTGKHGENGEFVETRSATQPLETLQFVDPRKPPEMREDCR